MSLRIFIGSLFVLVIGLLIGGDENANGQTTEFDPQKFDPLQTDCAVSYTHLTLPTNREV